MNVNNTDYKSKYIKYKNKYFNTKKMLGGETCENTIKQVRNTFSRKIALGPAAIDYMCENIKKDCGLDNGIFGDCEYVTENLDIISKNSKCIRLTKKRTDYYKYTYDGSVYSNDKYGHIFDTSKRSNCCKCISVCLYTKLSLKLKDAKKYLLSMYRTAYICSKQLTEWVVRLYLDYSVYDYIKNYDQQKQQEDDVNINVVFNELINMNNVEIYTYICEEPEYLSKLRILRFLPLIDNTVAKTIIREADGFVSYADCYNIEEWEKDKIPLYVLPVISEIITRKLKSYSSWLNIFKKTIQKKYFYGSNEPSSELPQLWNTHELLAGCIGVNGSINKEHFIETFKNLTQSTNDLINVHLNPDHNGNDWKRFYGNTKTDGEIFKMYVTDKYSSNSHQQIIDHIKMGFDEMFLLDIFKTLMCVFVGNGGINTKNKYVFEWSTYKNSEKITYDVMDYTEGSQQMFAVNTTKREIYYNTNTYNYRMPDYADILDEILFLKMRNPMIPTDEIQAFAALVNKPVRKLYKNKLDIVMQQNYAQYIKQNCFFYVLDERTILDTFLFDSIPETIEWTLHKKYKMNNNDDSFALLMAICKEEILKDYNEQEIPNIKSRIDTSCDYIIKKRNFLGDSQYVIDKVPMNPGQFKVKWISYYEKLQDIFDINKFNEENFFKYYDILTKKISDYLNKTYVEVIDSDILFTKYREYLEKNNLIEDIVELFKGIDLKPDLKPDFEPNFKAILTKVKTKYIEIFKNNKLNNNKNDIKLDNIYNMTKQHYRMRSEFEFHNILFKNFLFEERNDTELNKIISTSINNQKYDWLKITKRKK